MPDGEHNFEKKGNKYIDLGLIKKEKKPTKEEIIAKEVAKEEKIVAQQKKLAIEDEADLPPVYVNGEAFRMIDGKYVALDEADVIFLERKIKKDTETLELLKSNLK